MITYKQENPYDIKEELSPIAEEHYKGDPRSPFIELGVDWSLYGEAYKNGSIATIIARDEGAIIGYISAVISNHQHTKNSKIAIMDTIYVADSHREEGVGTELIINIEQALIDKGVDWFNAVFREEETAEGVLCGLGYDKVECVFGRNLKENP